MYSAFVGAEAPGQDGMRCAPFPISYAVSKDFFRVRVWGRRVRPLCHLIVRQQTWRKSSTPWYAEFNHTVRSESQPAGSLSKNERILAFH